MPCINLPGGSLGSAYTPGARRRISLNPETAGAAARRSIGLQRASEKGQVVHARGVTSPLFPSSSSRRSAHTRVHAAPLLQSADRSQSRSARSVCSQSGPPDRAPIRARAGSRSREKIFAIHISDCERDRKNHATASPSHVRSRYIKEETTRQRRLEVTDSPPSCARCTAHAPADREKIFPRRAVSCTRVHSRRSSSPRAAAA